LLLDIGGGSMEMAYGQDMVPEFAVSLPIGAGRLTRDLLRGDPPSQSEVKKLRRYVRDQLDEVSNRMRWEGPRTAVATSRTFQQLARLCGAPPMRDGPFAARVLRRRDLKAQIGRIAHLPAAHRAKLPGISAARARQALAGAVVAYAAMTRLRIDEVTICPWALREGILLRRLESAAGWQDHGVPLPVAVPRPAVPPAGADVAAVVPLTQARSARKTQEGQVPS
jgi:exopolyphosphatase/guanosine-5'-triphosphate,3'-diphosphate pyrophosphatase